MLVMTKSLTVINQPRAGSIFKDPSLPTKGPKNEEPFENKCCKGKTFLRIQTEKKEQKLYSQAFKKPNGTQ